MNLLLEITIRQGLLLDIFGVIGIGFVALAAIRFARNLASAGAAIMSMGAIALLVGRIGIMVFSYHVTPLNQADFDPTLIAVCKGVPITLLTLGLGAIVYGFWGHERQISAKSIAA